MPHAKMRLLGGIAVALLTITAVAAAEEDADKPRYPTTQFADDAKSASVSVGDVTATITMVANKDTDTGGEIPVLTVAVGGKQVLESSGTDADFEGPASEASIAEIDPDNHHPEVYFTSYSGGAHCCTTAIVAEEVGDKWVTVPIGDFDGDGDYLDDLDNDGRAEISTVDNRFLYVFDSYAASAAPLVIYSVRSGKVVDVTAEPRFLAAHRDWLKQIEEGTEPADRWTSRGFLAGWLGEKIRLGEGAAAWQEINSHWNFAEDEGEEACPNGGDPDGCAKKEQKILKFPERLRLFLSDAGYTF